MAKTPEPRPAPSAIRDELEEIGRHYAEAVQSLRGLFGAMRRAEDRVKDLGSPVPDAIALYARIYTVHEKCSDIAKHTLALKESIGKHLLPEAMDAASTDTLTISEGHRATRTEKVYASIPAEHREAAYQWLRDNGAEDLIQETVNASTLSAYAKNLAEDNRLLPDDLFKVTMLAAVSLTRAKGWNLEGSSHGV